MKKRLLNILDKVKKLYLQNKKEFLLMVMGISVLLIFIIGATYAYFQVQGDKSGNADINVLTGTTDLLSFKISKGITIDANESNFGINAGNLSDSATASAILRANNATNNASASYNVYFIIEENDLIYTTEDNKPELLLKVTDPNGNEIENITGLVHTSSGFDITTRTGSFLIIADYDIVSTSSKENTVQDWNIEVTLVNLDTDQIKNTGKKLSGKIYVTQEKLSSYELAQINSISATTTYNSIEAILNIENGTAAVNKYYFGIEETSNVISYKENNIIQLSNNLASADTVTFIESDVPNYKFADLKEETDYKIYSYAIDVYGIKSNTYETQITTDKYQLSTIDSVSYSKTYNSITVNVTATKGIADIVSYYYSYEYTESTSNTYTFNDLNDTTEYKVKIKVKDSNGRFSTEYYEAITTEVYILPVVANIISTSKYNSISLNVTGTTGTNPITKYMYAIDNETYVEGTETYTFNDLTEKTSYSIKVKAVDSIGRESNVYETTIRTDEYIIPSIANVSTTSTTNTITINITGTNGDGTITKYYYSKDDGSNYVSSTGNSYTFSNLTPGTTFYIKVYVEDNNGRISNIYSTSQKTEYMLLADYIQSLYTTDGENGLYLHDSDLENGAGDNSLRYAGANPDNYVCFGYDTETCPTDSLYRIIGVFDNQVKLIKYDYASSEILGNDNSYESTGTISSSYYKGTMTNYYYYYWNSSNTNTWSASDLNTANLNTNFINYIGSTWAEKIATHTWSVGGMPNSLTSTAKKYYDSELTNSTTYSAKIGLMYVSDYGFAASPDNWTTALRSYNNDTNRNNNWMFMGLREWTISRYSTATIGAFYVTETGYITNFTIGFSGDSVRPVFYLSSEILMIRGLGTQSDPYIISD